MEESNLSLTDNIGTISVGKPTVYWVASDARWYQRLWWVLSAPVLFVIKGKARIG